MSLTLQRSSPSCISCVKSNTRFDLHKENRRVPLQSKPRAVAKQEMNFSQGDVIHLWRNCNVTLRRHVFAKTPIRENIEQIFVLQYYFPSNFL